MMDPEKYASATVVSRRDPAPDLWIIRIRTDIDLPYRPGQYVTLGLQSNGRVIERPYSICSSPLENEIELFIERVPDGELSDPLFALGVGGDLIVRRRTKGLFLRDAPLLNEPHLFVATVTGIAPFVSMLRTLASRARAGDWTPVPVITIQGAARSVELGYADELVALEREFCHQHRERRSRTPRPERSNRARPGRRNAAGGCVRQRRGKASPRQLPDERRNIPATAGGRGHKTRSKAHRPRPPSAQAR